MTIDYKQLRLDGIYQMNPEGDLMMRVKVPAGILSCEQAEKIADIGENGVERRAAHIFGRNRNS